MIPAAVIPALLGLFLALQLADVLTTAKVLRGGGREVNPVMAWLMRKLGVGEALAVKLIVGGAVGVVGAEQAPAVLIPLCAVYIWAVVHNWRQIG